MSIKRVTLMEFRKNPGQYFSDVHRHGMEFLIVRVNHKANKITPIAKLVPVSADTVVLPDGTIIGPKPLTMGEELDSTY